MHIIIDCTTTQNQLKHHGIGVYTKNIIKNILRNKNIKFSLLLFNEDSTLDQILEDRDNNVEVVRIGKLRQSDYKNYFWYLVQFLPNILKIKQKDSVYLCPYFWTGIPSLFIPTVLVVHDMILPIFNIYSEKGNFHNFIKKMLYWLELRKAKYCKAIITHSCSTKDDFLKYFPKYDIKKVNIIYLDAELEGQDPNWDEKLPPDYKEKGYFIYIGGTVYKNKNSKGVVDGYKDFLKRLPLEKKPPYMIIAGGNFVKDDPLAQEFKEYVKNNNLKDRVIFTGFYKDNQVEQLLSHSIAMLHLSLYEGFGITLVEGMRAGTPVIAHNGSSYPEVLGDAGLLVDGLDNEDVGKTMFNIYRDEDFRKSLITKGLNRAKEFSWEKTTREVLNVLKNV